MTGPRVVALGGGHGLAASLRALRVLTDDLTAVVTVADDGGSSGRLRNELGVVPPGDLRMALSALAAGDDWSTAWAKAFQHRFAGDGGVGGHAVGNLVLSGLAEVSGSLVDALDRCARLLGVRGRVLPMSTTALDIVATVSDEAQGKVREVRGQVAVATTDGRVVDVRLVPEDPPACAEAVHAVLAADWVVLGPGSLFTSVIPHLLAPELRAAIVKTAARRVFALNLVPQTGETSGYSPEAHLEALASHAPDLRLDHVVADTSVLDRDGLMEAAAAFGAQVHYAAVASAGTPGQHDSERLAAAYRTLFDGTSNP